MRFLLTILADKKESVIPINYQYPLSAAIYRILDRADGAYAEFLHDRGYGKGFKLFTFSDLRAPFSIRGDRMLIQSTTAEFVICFHLPEAMKAFIKGLFASRQIVIADRKSNSAFEVRQVETLPDVLTGNDTDEVCSTLQPISPIVCGKKNAKGNYDFLSPEADDFSEMLLVNWREKCRALYSDEETAAVMEGSDLSPAFYRNPPKSRLITIKQDTAAETRIRGFQNFRLIVKGKKAAVELLLNSGVGLYNAMGMGCVEVE